MAEKVLLGHHVKNRLWTDLLMEEYEPGQTIEIRRWRSGGFTFTRKIEQVRLNPSWVKHCDPWCRVEGEIIQFDGAWIQLTKDLPGAAYSVWAGGRRDFWSNQRGAIVGFGCNPVGDSQTTVNSRSTQDWKRAMRLSAQSLLWTPHYPGRYDYPDKILCSGDSGGPWLLQSKGETEPDVLLANSVTTDPSAAAVYYPDYSTEQRAIIQAIASGQIYSIRDWSHRGHRCNAIAAYLATDKSLQIETGRALELGMVTEHYPVASYLVELSEGATLDATVEPDSGNAATGSFNLSASIAASQDLGNDHYPYCRLACTTGRPPMASDCSSLKQPASIRLQGCAEPKAVRLAVSRVEQHATPVCDVFRLRLEPK